MQVIKYKGVELGTGRYHEDMAYGIACAYGLLEKEIAAVLKPLGLNVAKFNILMVVKHIGQDKGLNQEEISKELIVTASTLSRVLRKVEKEGLIRYGAQEGDLRVKLTFITKKGSDLLDKVWPIYQKRLKELTERIPKTKQQTLAGLLTEWIIALHKK